MTREEVIANLKMIRVAFVDPVTKEQRKLIDDTFDMAIKALEQEPKTGHWIAEENEEMETIGYYCSECDLPMETEERTDFCPNCGCRMVEPQERSDKE